MCFRVRRKEDVENGSMRKMEWDRGAGNGRDPVGAVLSSLLFEVRDDPAASRPSMAAEASSLE